MNKQLNLKLFPEAWAMNSPAITAAIDKLASEAGTEARGAVFTRAEVVDFILDLVGYTENEPLFKKRLLEPSFGGGDFLLPVIRRLIDSWTKWKDRGNVVEEIGHAVCAVELHRETFKSTRQMVIDYLGKEPAISSRSAHVLADQWLIQGDFLLVPLTDKFDFVVGNPPYVRQELIPTPLLNEYKSRYQTIYDRADLYVPFIERSLLSLNEGGSMGFICADRWMKNRYGGPLRKLVAEKFHLRIYIDMVNTSAFQNDVIAYPAIFIFAREKSGPTRVAHRPNIDRKLLGKLAGELRFGNLNTSENMVSEVEMVTNGSEPWLMERPDRMKLVRHLEQVLPTLEEAGCKVGIGVATGADKVFIGDFNELDVERDRKLPLLTTRDICTGEVIWHGLGVINPFQKDGRLIDLKDYPRLHHYLEVRKEVIAGRHCAKKSPANWYRTIDRILPELSTTPKLLIPDIKGNAHIVYEDGGFYPHHNLYYITSEDWDLRALQAVLLSNICRFFVSTYSTRMRGGYMRFQAQYLRRIRLPHWQDVPEELKKELINAAVCRDFKACNLAAYRLYNLSREDIIILENEGE